MNAKQAKEKKGEREQKLTLLSPLFFEGLLIFQVLTKKGGAKNIGLVARPSPLALGHLFSFYPFPEDWNGICRRSRVLESAPGAAAARRRDACADGDHRPERDINR